MNRLLARERELIYVDKYGEVMPARVETELNFSTISPDQKSHLLTMSRNGDLYHQQPLELQKWAVYQVTI